jgi:hypothetical protein
VGQVRKIRYAHRHRQGARSDAELKDRRGRDMSQPVAIVTGVSRGIGRATAIRLVREFSAVVVVARKARKRCTKRPPDGTLAAYPPERSRSCPGSQIQAPLFHCSGLSSPIMVGMNSDTVG